MRALESLTGHVIYNLAYAYKFQLKTTQAKYMNDLLSIGVTGFRVDAAKHMWVADIEALQAKLNDVNSGGRPYFYMEVIDQCRQIILFITCQQQILNA
jgi:glycosidase